MRHIECRRREQYGRPKGQTQRRLVVVEVEATTRRVSPWQRRLLACAGSTHAELRLWASVLEDAITALRGRHLSSRGALFGRGSTARSLWREAGEWIMSREMEPLGTFESVCGVLELDTDAVRRDLCALAAQFSDPRERVALVKDAGEALPSESEPA